MAGVFSAARLAGKTVLITGASGGIGAATAILFARAGSNLILTARRQAQLDEVAAAAKKAHEEGQTGKGGKFVTLTVDMTDKKEVQGILGRIPEELKKVDILVNNAGLVFGTDKVGDIDDNELEIMFNTNVLGLIHLTQIFVREFKQRESGHIINLGSIAGKEREYTFPQLLDRILDAQLEQEEQATKAYANGAIYCATKFAVSAFNDSLRRELVSYKGIRVSQICPGMVETSFSVTRFRGDQSKADAVYQGLQPLVAEDIAEEIAWVASRPEHVQVADVLVFPSEQASATINVKTAPR